MTNTENQHNPFKEAIESFLRVTAKTNTELQKHLLNPQKNIDECLQFIINEVSKTKRQGFADEEIYGLALHYYEEPEIEVGGKISARVITNARIELTEEEIQEEKEKARQQVFDDAVSKLRKPTTTKTTPNQTEQSQLSLNM